MASCRAEWGNVQTEEPLPNNEGGRRGEKRRPGRTQEGRKEGKEYRRKALEESVNLSWARGARIGHWSPLPKKLTSSHVIGASAQDSSV